MSFVNASIFPGPLFPQFMETPSQRACIPVRSLDSLSGERVWNGWFRREERDAVNMPFMAGWKSGRLGVQDPNDARFAIGRGHPDNIHHPYSRTTGTCSASPAHQAFRLPEPSRGG